MKFIFILFSLGLLILPSISKANVLSGDISFSNCEKLCNSAGEREIRFHNKVDFTLRIIIDEDSYFPAMKVGNITNKKVNWSFHIVFFDENSNIVATYALSGETNKTSKYGQHTNSSRITMLPKDMNKIRKYKMLVYTF